MAIRSFNPEPEPQGFVDRTDHHTDTISRLTGTPKPAPPPPAKSGGTRIRTNTAAQSTIESLASPKSRTIVVQQSAPTATSSGNGTRIRTNTAVQSTSKRLAGPSVPIQLAQAQSPSTPTNGGKRGGCVDCEQRAAASSSNQAPAQTEPEPEPPRTVRDHILGNTSRTRDGFNRAARTSGVVAQQLMREGDDSLNPVIIGGGAGNPGPGAGTGQTGIGGVPPAAAEASPQTIPGQQVRPDLERARIRVQGTSSRQGASSPVVPKKNGVLAIILGAGGAVVAGPIGAVVGALVGNAIDNSIGSKP